MIRTFRKTGWKWLGAIGLAILLLLLWLPQAQAAAPILPTTVKTASSGCTLVGIEGQYISEATNAVKRINQIRYEACKEGVTNPDTGKPLTTKDYVPIQWSSDLEYIARIRAAEAVTYLSHTRPNGKLCFTAQSPKGVQSWAEDLAWNWSKSMVYGIEQWYGEKADWVKKTPGAVTGHYTSMINPKYTSIGMGTFYAPAAVYPNCTSAEFSTAKGMDGTKAKSVSSCVQTIEVQKSVVSNPAIAGKTKLSAGTSSRLSLTASLNLSSTIKNVKILDKIAWKSSDTSVAEVSQNGKLTGKKGGTTTITATAASGVKASVKVTVVKATNYTIKATAGAGGTVAGGGTKAKGAAVTLKATPNNGYYFVGWKEGSKVVSSKQTYTFTAAKNRTLTATFAKLAKPAATAKSAGATSVKISWKKVSGATGYQVYRATSKTGAYKKVKTVKSGATVSYTDTGLTAGRTYYYKVRTNAAGTVKNTSSGFSSVIGAKPVPAKPGSVKAGSAGATSVKISWKKVSGASGYEVYRSTSKTGTYKKVKTVKSGATVSYTDASLTSGKTYYYKVRAYRMVSGKKVRGSYGAVASAKPIPSKPAISVTSTVKKQVKITWKKVAGASGYEVYRGTSKTGTYKKVKTVKSGATVSYTNASLTGGKTYYYKVRAYRTVGGKKVYSSYSAVKGVKVKR